MSQFKALLVKELKEAFRDKRALVAALMIAFLAPIMIVAISKTTIKAWAETPPVYIDISGAEFAPKLLVKLKADNILPLADAEDSVVKLWSSRKIELIIPENFAANMQQGYSVDVVLRADFSEKPLLSPLRRIAQTIATYSQTIVSSRLIMRGIDTQLLIPVNLLEQDLAVPSSNAVFITTLLGMFLLMGAFMSGLSVAIDSSAGERERNVLEMLLCQPVKTIHIVWAKLLCSSSISTIGVVLTLLLTCIAVGFVDLTKIGATFTLSFYEVSALLALLLPICLFAAALQLFFSFKAKSFKEAQSSVTMIIMLPALMPMVLTFIDDRPAWLHWLPILGQSLIMENLFKSLPINWFAVAFTSMVTIALTLVLAQVLAHQLKSEKTILAL